MYALALARLRSGTAEPALPYAPQVVGHGVAKAVARALAPGAYGAVRKQQG